MSLPFDPAEYEVVRAPVVDEFTYEGTDPDTNAAMRVTLSKRFLEKTAETMNAKFKATGDLCPIVVGHTVKDAKEIDQPPAVGFLHNYDVAPFGDKQVPTLWADHYIRKQVELPINGVPMRLSAKQLCEMYPRRSGEIWLGTYEVDPHSMLGATTPHRSLGILKLSADGKAAFGYSSPGALHMADAVPTENKTGEFAELKAILQQNTTLLGQVFELLTQTLQQPGPEAGHGGGEGEGSFDDFLKGLEGGGEGGGDKKKEEKPEPKEEKEEEPEKVKLARENDELRVKLARAEVTTQLRAEVTEADATNEELIQDMIAMPEDMRKRFLLRLARGRQAAAPGVVPVPGRGGVPSAMHVALNTATGGNGKRITSAAERDSVLQLARKKGTSYEAALKELGYALPGE